MSIKAISGIVALSTVFLTSGTAMGQSWTWDSKCYYMNHTGSGVGNPTTLINGQSGAPTTNIGATGSASGSASGGAMPKSWSLNVEFNCNYIYSHSTGTVKTFYLTATGQLNAESQGSSASSGSSASWSKWTQKLPGQWEWQTETLSATSTEQKSITSGLTIPFSASGGEFVTVNQQNYPKRTLGFKVNSSGTVGQGSEKSASSSSTFSYGVPTTAI